MKIRTIYDAAPPANVIGRIHHRGAANLRYISSLSSTSIKRYRGVYAETTVIFNGTAREFNVAFSAITERIYRGRRNCNRGIKNDDIYYCCRPDVDRREPGVSHSTRDSHLANRVSAICLGHPVDYSMAGHRRIFPATNRER